jgi:hypothetical protein
LSKVPLENDLDIAIEAGVKSFMIKWNFTIYIHTATARK